MIIGLHRTIFSKVCSHYEKIYDIDPIHGPEKAIKLHRPVSVCISPLGLQQKLLSRPS